MAANMNPAYIITPYAATPFSPASFNSCILKSILTTDEDMLVTSSDDPFRQANPMDLKSNLVLVSLNRLWFLWLKK